MIGFWADFFTFLQVAIGLFLIFIIMLQRGKGGGLVGALGGMGGASAFGPKADIQVLKLTIGLAIAWVVMACIGIFCNRAYHVANPVGDKANEEVKEPKDKKGKDESKNSGETKSVPAGKAEPGAEPSGNVDEKKTPAAGAKPSTKTPPAAKADPKASTTDEPAVSTKVKSEDKSKTDTKN